MLLDDLLEPIARSLVGIIWEAIAELFLGGICELVGQIFLNTITLGRYPPEPSTHRQDVLCQVIGLMIILLVIWALFFVPWGIAAPAA